MLESMNMSGGAQANYFPNSGPGNKTLAAGDATHGYFGTVTTTDMFTASEVDSFLVGLTGTAYGPSDLVWHKFVLDGKFLFVPNRAFRSTTWNNIYNASLMYGVDGNGAYPPAAGGVNQLYQVSKKVGGRTFGFKVRTVKGGLTDPLSALSTADASEYNRLLMSLTTGKFGTMTIAQLDLNVYEETQTTYSANTNNNWVRFNTASAQTNKTAAYNWRPVLELTSTGESLVAAMNVAMRNTVLGEQAKSGYLGDLDVISAATQIVPTQPPVNSYPDTGVGSGLYATLVSASTVVSQSNNWSAARGTATYVTE
jgi:hypothetical protein